MRKHDKIFHQLDNQYANFYIGESNLTIREAGSFVCSLCTLIAKARGKITPDILVQNMVFRRFQMPVWSIFNCINLPIKFLECIENGNESEILQRLRLAYVSKMELAIVAIPGTCAQCPFQWRAVMDVEGENLRIADTIQNKIVSINIKDILATYFFKVVRQISPRAIRKQYNTLRSV